jgi:hypothetical protein
MQAYKFLAPDGSGRFSGFLWEPKRWVDTPEPIELCRRGIHACRNDQLPYWLDEQLWSIELERAVEFDEVLLAPRARLLAPVEAWNMEAAREFGLACVERIRERGPSDYGDDAAATAESAASVQGIALAAYFAAEAAEAAEPGGGGRAERAWQAGWLRDRLGL